ncbi:MAG: tetratricopeptide repeat protein [Kofleriaceae bacterium]
MGDLVSLTLGPRKGLLRGTRATSWYELGCSLESTAPEAAIAAYERAIAGRPDLADAYNNLGRIHHERRTLAVAESCYRIALCIENGVALYWFNLGVVVEDQGRYAEALAAYAHALELDPAFENAHFNTARLLELEGRRSGDELAIRTAIRHLTRYRQLVKQLGHSHNAPGC